MPFLFDRLYATRTVNDTKLCGALAMRSEHCDRLHQRLLDFTFTTEEAYQRQQTWIQSQKLNTALVQFCTLLGAEDFMRPLLELPPSMFCEPRSLTAGMFASVPHPLKVFLEKNKAEAAKRRRLQKRGLDGVALFCYSSSFFWGTKK